jgi:hypothetical protein
MSLDLLTFCILALCAITVLRGGVDAINRYECMRNNGSVGCKRVWVPLVEKESKP